MFTERFPIRLAKEAVVQLELNKLVYVSKRYRDNHLLYCLETFAIMVNTRPYIKLPIELA